jgi:hypothetical protein
MLAANPPALRSCRIGDQIRIPASELTRLATGEELGEK